MKIRNGFVSNSSSSSFILTGYKVPSSKFDSVDFDSLEDIDDVYDLLNEHDIEFKFDDSTDTYYIICGEVLDMEEMSVIKLSSINTNEKLKTHADEFFKKYNINVSEDDLGVYGGTIYG